MAGAGAAQEKREATHALSRRGGLGFVLSAALVAWTALASARAMAQDPGAAAAAALPAAALPAAALPAALPTVMGNADQTGAAAGPGGRSLEAGAAVETQAGSSPATSTAGDPPSRVVRVSVLKGNVSAEPASVNTFSPAEMNQVLTTGDRVYTDAAAEAELQAGQIALRLGGGADLTITAMTDTLGQFGLAAGSLHLRSFAIDAGTVLELDTPEAAVTVLQPGDVRVDVDAASHLTTVSLISGQVQVDGLNFSQVLTPGQAVRLHGPDPQGGQEAYAEPLSPAAPTVPDALDGFSDGRDTMYASGTDGGSPYLNADTTGAADLATYGAWDTSESADLGPVWFPVVAVDWQPYRFGHWRWVPPWGWTWVGVEPWGFAPFHYGRWALLNSRWGWIPGSPAVRPVYAPALVAFAGGAQISASLGYAPGVGITAWFPLGAREPYAPPYHGSTLYLNRVNASNLYNPNAAEVRGFYNQRAINVFTAAPAQGRTYANRLQGTVAIPQTSFAAGLDVGRAVLHLDPEVLAAAPVVAHPPVTPERSMLVPRRAAVLPPVLMRPVLATHAAGPSAQPETNGAVLFHLADPPAPRPSFEQQREVMDRTEPGRPLSPAQMETLPPNHAGRVPSPGMPSAAPGHAATPPPRPAPPATPAGSRVH